MSRAEDAVMRLYESASIRDELTDDEAKALFAWAEDELVRLDESGVDDDTFDARVRTLMNLVKQINRYAGRQGQPSAQGVDETPQQIVGLAGDLGHPTSPDQIADASTGDPLTTVQALTSLLSDQSSAQASTQANATAPEPTSQPDQVTDTTEPSDQAPEQAPEQAADLIPHDPLTSTPAGDQQIADESGTPTAAPADYLPLNPFGDDVEEPTDPA